MAQANKVPQAERAKLFEPDPSQKHLRTSIGRSPNTRPTNKHKRRAFKRYRGQGKS